MDLKNYYRELAEQVAAIESKDVYVMSLATPDGGKAGVMTQVPKRVAGQLMVERRARLASEVEIAEFEAAQEESRQAAAAAMYASRIHVQVMSDPRETLREKPVKG